MRSANTGLPDAAWDDRIAAADGHFLQTSAWMRVQQELGHRVWWQNGDGWFWSAAERRTRGGLRHLYAAYGPHGAPMADAMRSLADAARTEGFDFARAEPDTVDEAAPAAGAVPAPAVQPRHTLLIDLRRSEEELRGDLTSGRRRSINTAEKKGITLRRSRDPKDVEIFIDLIHKTGERNRFNPHPDSYYRTLCEVLCPLQAASIYVADHEGAHVAAVIGFESRTTAYYAHAAADAELSRKVVAAAPLAWRMIMDARDEGRHTFDFWGVLPDDSIDHPWAGFSRFKKTFGGTLLTRPGCFDIPLKPWRYRLYRVVRRAARGG